MQVTEQGQPTSRHADTSGRWQLLMLLLFAVALGCYQRGELSILVVMISNELRLAVVDVGYVLASFGLASTVGFLLMAVFIWREKGWAGCAVLGILGVLGALLIGASSGVGGLVVASGITGLAYGGLLVGSYRIVGGWLPPESHGLAIGLLFAVTQSMRVFPGLITVKAIDHVGWRWSSRIVAGLWFLWVLLWIFRLRRPADTLRCEQPRGLVTLAQMFKDRVTWIVVVGVALASPLLSFQSGRLLGHLNELAKAGPAGVRELALGYLFPAVGLPAMAAVAAGLISDTLIRKGWSTGKSRTLLATICGLLMALPAPFAFSRDRVSHLLFATLTVTAGQSLFAVLYAALVDAVPGRGIVVGVGLSGWLGGLMGSVANIMTEPVTSRWGYGPLVVGFSILTLIAIICVRPLTRKMPGELMPA